MAFPALIARFFPWGAAAQAGVKLAQLGMDYKVERDKLKVIKRAKDFDQLEARLDAIEKRFEHQLQVMQELASGLEREVGKMRRGLVAAWVASAAAGALALVALVAAF